MKTFKQHLELKEHLKTDESLTEEKLLLEHPYKKYGVDSHDLYGSGPNGEDWWRNHDPDGTHENNPFAPYPKEEEDVETKQSADRIAGAQKAVANFVSQQQSPQSGA